MPINFQLDSFNNVFLKVGSNNEWRDYSYVTVKFNSKINGYFLIHRVLLFWYWTKFNTSKNKRIYNLQIEFLNKHSPENFIFNVYTQKHFQLSSQILSEEVLDFKS